jgi:hypothetical protein
MDAITLSVEIPEDRRLVIELPQDTPTGTAEIVIKPQGISDNESVSTAREIARAKLLAGGALNTSHRAAEGAVALSNEELERLGQLAPGARSSEDILDEERGVH